MLDALRQTDLLAFFHDPDCNIRARKCASGNHNRSIIERSESTIERALEEPCGVKHAHARETDKGPPLEQHPAHNRKPNAFEGFSFREKASAAKPAAERSALVVNWKFLHVAKGHSRHYALQRPCADAQGTLTFLRAASTGPTPAVRSEGRGRHSSRLSKTAPPLFLR